jgi:hypothetical protein
MSRACSAVALCVSLSFAAHAGFAKEPAASADKTQPTKFLRVERDADEKPLTLQTAVVHYEAAEAGATDSTVDLIGAVHIGEPSYYDDLNKLFEKYDVVLYELVAPAGTRIAKGAKPGNHPIAMLQSGMKDMLALEHQLEHIDYTKENLVHADMSPDDFEKSMSDRGESMWTMMLRMMGEGMARQATAQASGKSVDAEILLALFDKNRALALKRIMAEQFDDMGGMSAVLDGPQGSTIITERNKVALKQVAKEIDAGKKRIAVFYGAGHLPDMERHLLADFKLKRGEEKWLTAWHLAGAEKKPAKN